MPFDGNKFRDFLEKQLTKFHAQIDFGAFWHYNVTSPSLPTG